jgi:antitoxin (DNA-binding transcriptional repressor) of toxin-antitoxin stability system
MCHIPTMSRLNARQLHNETSAVLDEVAKGKSFEIARNGKIIGMIQPIRDHQPEGWDEIMAEVWAAHKRATGKTRNPVLAERKRRRR